mmetsp:Transcript_40357/g.108270  ORF Transcript_40357/g.108270 Transcript_40357/m.108270 type:complete len:98 (-) Transcript_40357:1275-1568(-)
MGRREERRKEGWVDEREGERKEGRTDGRMGGYGWTVAMKAGKRQARMAGWVGGRINVSTVACHGGTILPRLLLCLLARRSCSLQARPGVAFSRTAVK